MYSPSSYEVCLSQVVLQRTCFNYDTMDHVCACLCLVHYKLSMMT